MIEDFKKFYVSDISLLEIPRECFGEDLSDFLHLMGWNFYGGANKYVYWNKGIGGLDLW